MKAVIFGSTGKVGHGLVSGLENSIITSLYQPLRSELDLLNSKGVEEYIYNISPDVIIQAAGLTTNKESSYSKIKEVFRFNSAINKNITKAARKLKKCIYIDIGSASIYENLPFAEVFEYHFNLLKDFSPSIPYSKSKFEQSQIIVDMVKNGNQWYSVILPYVVSTNIGSNRSNLGLFNRISRNIVHAHNNELTYELPFEVDGNLYRQFVHSFDVGRFCSKIIEFKLRPGVLHMPNLPFISLNKFIYLHNQKLNNFTDVEIKDSGSTFLHPKLNSNFSNDLKFDYTFNANNIVRELINVL